MVTNTAKSESLREKYGLDIEQLDYKFIRKCDKVNTIENILKVLHSGQEGIYPKLIRFAEERLRALKPDSVLLRIEQSATSVQSLSSNDRQELLTDLKTWKRQVSAVDADLRLTSTKNDSPVGQLPPIRGAVQFSTAPIGKQILAPQQKSARISSYDYAAWDRYDVEAQLKMLDEREVAAKPDPQPERSDPAIDDQPPVDGLSAAERSALALRERQTGNEYFINGDFGRAAVYYTRSINASPTAAAFNNRAQAHLKLDKYGSALLDCNAVLRREPGNVKALLRRGIARQMSRDWMKARADFQQVMQAEPSNRQAQHHLAVVEKAIIGSGTNRSKVLIQEVDSIEEDAKTRAVGTGYCGEQMGTNGSDRDTSQGGVPAVDASNAQKEAKRTEDESTKEREGEVQENPRNGSEQQSILIHENAATNGSDEEVPMNESSQNRIAHIDGTSDNAKYRSFDDYAISQEYEEKSSTLSRSLDAKASLDGSEITDLSSETLCKYTSTSTSGKSLLEKAGCHNRRVTPSPDGPNAVTPRRWSTFAFVREWRSARRSEAGLAAAAALLRSVAPHQLPELLGSELDSAILSAVIRCVDEVMLAEDGPEQCQRLLERLTDARRFHAVKLLLDNRDRERLRAIAERLQRHGADISLLMRRFLG